MKKSWIFGVFVSLALSAVVSADQVSRLRDLFEREWISWPGQALAYKLGELEIKRLRGEAEEALGERFDLREFHDAVLANGSVPLPVLRQVIESFIQASRPSSSG
jgi:uncharacterized protein (DUF885 family)